MNAKGVVLSRPLFSVVAVTKLGAVAEKKTKKCFTGSRYAYRDDDFDNWLPANQPNAQACVISTLEFSKEFTFREAVASILDISASTDIKSLDRFLIEHGYTMTLPQAEEMVEKTEYGERTEVCTDVYANFFFVETGDEKNRVSVGDVHRIGRAWGAHIDRLNDNNRWIADYRFLLRNLDASKLNL